MIRLASKSDSLNLSVLATQVWLETYAINGVQQEHLNFVAEEFDEVKFIEKINSPNWHIFVKEESGSLQGFVQINLYSKYDHNDFGFEVEKLYVFGSNRGEGVGKLLLQEAQKHFGPKCWLYTWTENASNSFYKHLGFKNIGRYDFDFNGNTICNNVYVFD